MAAVLGDVLYWLAALIAGITIGVALYHWIYMPPDDPLEVWLLVAIGVVTWLLGRALRRALAGRDSTLRKGPGPLAGCEDRGPPSKGHA